MKYKSIKRLIYIILTLVLFVIEVIIGLYVHDNFVRPYIGDVLIVILIYTFVHIWRPEEIRLLPLYIFLFGVITECLQYIHIVELLSLQHNTFMRVLIGSTFDWSDIVCYGVGCVLCWIADVVVRK